MTGCPEWAEALVRYALGEPTDTVFADHLTTCSRCTEALVEICAAAERMDAALGRLGAIEPPPFGADRVMARVAARNRPMWNRWVPAISAAAILIAIAVWTLRPKPQPDIRAFVEWRSPTQILLRPPVAAAWTVAPHLGEGIIRLKPSGESNAQ